jgi:glycosyltransferase involved in cell wall biosynthesis
VSGRRRPLRRPVDALGGLVEVVRTHGGRMLECAVGEVTRRGAYAAPITTGPDRTVLLFYEDVEHDTLVPNDRYLRRAARRLYHAVTHGQRVSGFEVAFHALVRALELVGCRVVINNPALARRHPTHPIGIAGYPHVLDRWTLPNPAVLGPGLYDHPAQAPQLMRDPRFRSYLVPCEWMAAMFAPYYPERCRLWFGGIDVAQWPDALDTPKDIDLIVYDKVRWARESFQETLIAPVESVLRARGLRTVWVRRGGYDHAEYRALLGRARGMVFLCESETQGLAYQEAMASGVPILAWDPEEWLDPERVRWTSEPVRASSVPFFSAECGERFRDAAAFEGALDRFLARIPTYTPRSYVEETLSLERSAELYLAAYTAAAIPQDASQCDRPVVRNRQTVA